VTKQLLLLNRTLGWVLTEVVPGVGPWALRTWVEDPVPVRVTTCCPMTTDPKQPPTVRVIPGRHNFKVENVSPLTLNSAVVGGDGLKVRVVGTVPVVNPGKDKIPLKVTTEKVAFIATRRNSA